MSAEYEADLRRRAGETLRDLNDLHPCVYLRGECIVCSAQAIIDALLVVFAGCDPLVESGRTGNAERFAVCEATQMGRPPEEAEVRHAKGLAQKLRDATAEGQSPWTDEGTCLVFADAAKTLDSLAYGVLAQARVIEAADRYVATRKSPGYSAVQAAAAFNDLAAALVAVGETESPPEGTKP